MSDADLDLFAEEEAEPQGEIGIPRALQTPVPFADNSVDGPPNFFPAQAQAQAHGLPGFPPDGDAAGLGALFENLPFLSEEETRSVLAGVSSEADLSALAGLGDAAPHEHGINASSSNDGDRGAQAGARRRRCIAACDRLGGAPSPKRAKVRTRDQRRRATNQVLIDRVLQRGMLTPAEAVDSMWSSSRVRVAVLVHMLAAIAGQRVGPREKWVATVVLVYLCLRPGTGVRDPIKQRNLCRLQHLALLGRAPDGGAPEMEGAAPPLFKISGSLEQTPVLFLPARDIGRVGENMFLFGTEVLMSTHADMHSAERENSTAAPTPLSAAASSAPATPTRAARVGHGGPPPPLPTAQPTMAMAFHERMLRIRRNSLLNQQEQKASRQTQAQCALPDLARFLDTLLSAERRPEGGDATSAVPPSLSELDALLSRGEGRDHGDLFALVKETFRPFWQDMAGDPHRAANFVQIGI